MAEIVIATRQAASLNRFSARRNKAIPRKAGMNMDKIVNNEGYLRSGLMDIAGQLLTVCNETGATNIQLITSPWKEGKGITLLAKVGDKPVLSVKMDTAYEKE